MAVTSRICAAVFAVALAAPAFAEGPYKLSPASISASADGLDLTTKNGQSLFTKRLYNAMVKVCGDRPAPALIERTANYTACKASLTLDVNGIDQQVADAAFAKAKAWLD